MVISSKFKKLKFKSFKYSPGASIKLPAGLGLVGVLMFLPHNVKSIPLDIPDYMIVPSMPNNVLKVLFGHNLSPTILNS